MKYALMLCFVLIGFNTYAHQNCLMVLLNKIKSDKKGYHTIEESKPILYPSKRSLPINDNEIEIPTLAQDPVRFARFYWGFELSFFDKN